MRERWARLNVIVQVCFLLVVGTVLIGAVAQLGTLITAGPIQAVRVVDGLSNQLAAVDHFGAIGVAIDSSRLTADRLTISHISSLTHVFGRIQVSDDTCPTCRARVDHFNALANQPHISGALRAWQVNTCGVTATQGVATNANRRDLILKNLGGGDNPERSIIFLGFGTTGHVALSTNNGYPLAVHLVMTGAAGVPPSVVSVTPDLVIANYQGPISCIAHASSAILSVIEILR